MTLLILGANGQVGREIVKLFSSTSHRLISYNRSHLDCTRLELVQDKLMQIKPDVIINAAAYTAVDKAEEDADKAHQINHWFVRELAGYCNNNQIPLIHLSTDYVFNGKKDEAYKETDMPLPLGVYAQSKWAGEQAIITNLQQHIILRISWVFGVYGTNFVKTILKLASSREELNIVCDQWGRPTAARDVARVVLEITERIINPAFKDWGIYHYAGSTSTNWYDFARTFLTMLATEGYTPRLAKINPIPSEHYVVKAPRPKNSVLNTDKIEQIMHITSVDWRIFIPELLHHFMNEEHDELSIK